MLFSEVSSNVFNNQADLWYILLCNYMEDLTYHECQLVVALPACVDLDDTKIRDRTRGSYAFVEFEDIPLSSLKEIP